MKSTSSFFPFICWMNKQKTLFFWLLLCQAALEGRPGREGQPATSVQSRGECSECEDCFFGVSSSGFWLHSPVMRQVFPETSSQTSQSPPLSALPTNQRQQGGVAFFTVVSGSLTASEELRTLHVLEAHRLRFAELIKTLMATRSLVRKNRSFIIDYSAKTTIQIRITSPWDLLQLK